MTVSVLAEGDTAVTNTKFLPFGDFSGENRPKKKKKESPNKIKQETYCHHYYEINE